MIFKDVELLRNRLVSFSEPYVKAVLLFGSRARGERGERSDVDLLVLHERCEGEDPVFRRRRLYGLLRGILGGEFEDVTVFDMGLERFLKPEEITSLLLNLYMDSVVVYDETGRVDDFLRRIRERILESGLKRVGDGRAYYWVLPEPLKEVKFL